MLKATGIRKSYGNLQILKGVNFEVQKGEIVSIIGPSGAGKSTLLHILGTLDKPDEGAVELKGTVISKLSGELLSAFRNQNIGFVFQFHHLLPEFSALENICIPAFIAKTNKKQAETRGLELLELFGLKDRAQHKPNQLSGGEQQRVAIARA
ncbi:MAG: ATP-binding cassette domain-containing protein, partial [Pedobacter sp.]